MRPMQMVAGALMLGTAAFAVTPASAGVSFGIGIGIPGPSYYSVRTGACGDPNFAYYHPYQCGYPQYYEPVYLDGAWVHEPLYYRTYAGSRYFWWHGGWHGGWHRGWGWHGGWHRWGWGGGWHRWGWGPRYYGFAPVYHCWWTPWGFRRCGV